MKTVGISFGHQAIAQALGGHVGRNPKGSEVSVRSAWVTKAGEQVFLPPLNEFRLHYHHNDAILKLPPGFLNLASNNVTEFQSIVSKDVFQFRAILMFLLCVVGSENVMLALWCLTHSVQIN